MRMAEATNRVISATIGAMMFGMMWRRMITGVRTQKVFNGGVVGNRMHLVVSTRTGDVGYFVNDNEAWTAAINAALSPDTLPG